jgi:hypothetical protein
MTSLQKLAHWMRAAADSFNRKPNNPLGFSGLERMHK